MHQQFSKLSWRSLFRRVAFVLAMPCFLAVQCFLAVPAARADGAYSWQDSQGRTHYGSNPPRNAINVQSLSGKFSRYSSDKLLKPYRGTTITETDVKETKPKKDREPPPRTITPGLDALSEETLVPELVQGPIVIKYDPQKRVTECSVTVKNSANIPATNVIVNFEFEDGTLVPTTGPESIDADSTAKYSVPETMLPITISGVRSDRPGPKPKVSIKGGA